MLSTRLHRALLLTILAATFIAATAPSALADPGVNEADLAITSLTDNPDPALTGGTVIYTATAQNFGDADGPGPGDAGNTQVQFTIPIGTTFNPGASSSECSDNFGLIFL